MLHAIALLSVFTAQPLTLNATLASPGGPLAFQLELSGASVETLEAFVINGPERIEIPTVKLIEDGLLFRFDHYDSEIKAYRGEDGLTGEWTKVGAQGKTTIMPFRAEVGFESVPMTPVERTPLETRHLVRFESSDDPAVLLIQYDGNEPLDHDVTATFMTTTGDYRYLAGTLIDRALTLSVFDGAHAFLFKATMNDAGGFDGHFWSRDTWHETWTSTPDPDAHLPDAFAQTTWNDDATLDDLVFTDLNGAPTAVASLRDDDQAMVIKVFGTWCPNCHDAGIYLSELADRYPDVAFVGLAFEHTADHERSVEQVIAYKKRHDIDFPILVAGLSDKARATEQLGALDRVRSFPTTIFVDRQGRIRAIHTGFTGPATGQAYQDLRAEFERLIEEIQR